MAASVQGYGPTLTINGDSIPVFWSFNLAEEKDRAMKTALIFGANGQDGSYLSELLLAEGWRVYGVVRRTSSDNLDRLGAVLDSPYFHLLSGDVTDLSSVLACLQTSQPHHIYNLTAQSHVGTSFAQPKLTTDVTYLGCLNILEAARLWEVDSAKKLRIYQASSSEMFGCNYTEKTWLGDKVGVATDGRLIYLDDYGRPTFEQVQKKERFQNEGTPLFPCSPYGVAKLAAHHLCRVYRHAYALDVRCGILFNHESPRRGDNFVTKKVVNYIGRLIEYANKQKYVGQIKKSYSTMGAVTEVSCQGFPLLELGNCDAVRDWGHAKDYVRAMYLLMTKEDLDKDDYDLVIGTGESHTVKDFVKAAFKVVGVNSSAHVKYNTVPNLRPYDVEYLRADASRAKNILGWSPTISFSELVHEMVESVL